jgi:hypothetical protein
MTIRNYIPASTWVAVIQGVSLRTQVVNTNLIGRNFLEVENISVNKFNVNK